MRKYATLLLVLTVILFALYSLTLNVGKPFWGHHDFNSNTWSIAAKNNIYLGLGCTKLGQVVSFSKDSCEDLVFYNNHPPLITWLLTGSVYLLGYSETNARLPFILFSLGSVWLIYLIGKELFSRPIGFLASSLFVVTPMFRFFGKSINHEPVVMFFLLAGVLSYVLWYRGNIRAFYAFVASAFFVGLTGWHGYLLYPLLVLVTLKFKKELFLKSLLPVIILVIIFLGNLIHSYILLGYFSSELFDWFFVRTSIVRDSLSIEENVSFNFNDFVKLMTARFINLYSILVFALGFAYLIKLVKDWLNKVKITFENTIVLALIVNALLVITIFNQQAFNHDYLLFYFLPFLTLASAKVIRDFGAKLGIDPFLGIAIVLVLFLSGNQYTQLLEEKVDPFAENQVKLGKEIAKNINSNYLILETPGYKFQNPFLGNYAHGSKIMIANLNLEDYISEKDRIDENYDYVIFLNDFPIDYNLREFLLENYERSNFQKFSIFLI